MSFDPEKVTFFAKTDARGQNIPFGIKAKDRQRHMYIIGKTGMGKSTTLENMAVQDIQSGEGLAFIDPHGSTAETLLDFVPDHRKEDVLYFAPFDMEHPVSFNIMEDVGPDKRHLVVSGLMSVFEKIWVDAWSARMAYILQNTLMALLEYPDSTLLGVNRMLSDKKYRDKVVANVQDPGVKSFWVDEFAKYNERYMQEAGDAIKNKIGQFTANPVIRNIIGQPKSSFDIRKIMDERKILIMNLSKGLIGETNANLLGSMLTTRIYLAAMSRADLSQQEMRRMPNFYFYVDEFQSFANSTFANILSEARKYHLNLIIAHQYITQMEDEVKDAVFGNVGTIISFRVGPFDAEVLETIFKPQFEATDIVNLGFAQVYLTLMIDGIGSPPFSATTLPPIEPPRTSYKDIVIASSRKQFARNRAEVEEAVIAFHQASHDSIEEGQKKPSKPNGRNKFEAPRESERRASPAPAETQTQTQAHSQTPPTLSVSANRESRTERRGEPSPKQSNEQRRRERDPDELRNVLRSIASSSTEKKGEGVKPGAGERKGDRSARTSEEPRSASSSRNGERTHTPEPQKSEREDLKAVLAKALQGNGASTKPVQGTPNGGKGGAGVQKKSASTKSATKPEPQTENQKSALESAETQTASESGPVQPTASNPAATQKEEQQKEPKVSAKELERMMRITTSDRPPK